MKFARILFALLAAVWSIEAQAASLGSVTTGGGNWPTVLAPDINDDFTNIYATPVLTIGSQAVWSNERGLAVAGCVSGTDGGAGSSYTINLVTACIDAALLGTDSVSADELNATGVEAELEAVLDLADLQGDLPLGTKTSGNYAAGDAEAGAALTGDTATAFFSAGTIEDARIAGSAEVDEVLNSDLGDFTCTAGSCAIDANAVALTTDTTGNYAAGDAEAGNALTGDSATAFFSSGFIEVARGGNGAAPGADDQVFVSSSTSAGAWATLPDSEAAGTILGYDVTTNAFSTKSDDDVPDAADFGALALTGDVTSSGLATTIAANSVALTTDTTGNYVLDVADGTGIDGTCASEGCTFTPTLDLTEISSTTWGAGAFTTMTFNAGAVDPVFTFGSGTFDISAVTIVTLDDEVELRFFEEDAGGTNYKGFKAPAAITANTTCTFENDADFIPDSCVGDGSDDDVPEAGDYTNLAATSPITQSGGTISTSISTGRLVGRTTASSGVMEQITPDATLSLTGLALSVVDVTCTGCLGTTEIAGLDAANDITTGSLADARMTLKTESFCFSLDTIASDATAGTNKNFIRMPYAFTVTAVTLQLMTAATGGTLFTVDINEAGSTILSTKLTTDASEDTSTTAATAAVISDSSLAANAKVTFDTDAIGSTTAGRGPQACIIGHQ